VAALLSLGLCCCAPAFMLYRFCKTINTPAIEVRLARGAFDASVVHATRSCGCGYGVDAPVCVCAYVRMCVQAGEQVGKPAAGGGGLCAGVGVGLAHT
jgi:hypothetical protein